MAKLSEIEVPLLQFEEAAAPATPAAGLVRIYAKTDGLLYSKDDAGAETAMGASGIPATIFDAKGDLIAASAADTAARLAAAANGAALITASGESTGLKWRLNNDGAAVAPAVTDDSGDGYSIGSRWLDTTADKEYVALDVSVGAAVWVETTATGGGAGASDDLKQRANGYALELDWTAGKYQDGGITSLARVSSIITSSHIYFTPIYVPKAITVDRIGFNCVTGSGAGEEVRLGIYESGADGMPGALLLDAGTVAVTTNGGKEIIISQALAADTVYWLALFTNASVNLNALCHGDGAGPPFFITGLTGSEPSSVVVRALTYAALPNPAGTVTVGTGSDVTKAPSIRVRVT